MIKIFNYNFFKVNNGIVAINYMELKYGHVANAK